MGCSQSTEAGSGGAVQASLSSSPAIQNASSSLNAVHRNAPASSHTTGNKNDIATTDPADNSRHSLDESIHSFSSEKSSKSQVSTHSSRKSGTSGTSRRSSNPPKHGYTSGTSTPDVELGDASSIGSTGERSGASGASSNGMKRNPKSLGHSSSIIGLDSMIENRREEGNLSTNVVHMEVPFGKPIEEVYDGVHTGPVLGSGISGLVRLVTHKATGVKYAVKCLDLGLVDTPEGLAQLREEIFIMCQLDHPNIVRLEEVYESHTEIYLVQELCLGGELFDRLDEQLDYHYTEAECARLVKQMLSAVRYLHSKGIIHRDLKLENFLFSSTSGDSELKMIDFGLSKHFRYGEVQHEAVGTPYTVAPEVIRGSYDERCDIWAIGVISFLLLSGEPPFGGCGGPEPLMTVRGNILSGAYGFEPADIWDLVSQGAKDFIRALLVTDPKSRPTARETQKLPWLKEWASRTRTEGDNILNPNVVKALVNFKEFSDMRKLLCEVLSFTLLPEQIKDLRKEFEKVDTDGSGEISLAALKQVLVLNAGAGSLGALTEKEVEDIFNAMRVQKTETRIHWHEFIAAGLSQCQVDDRNLRLAFDRLDSDHKGYVTLDDIMDLMGNDALQSEEGMRKMWGDSMKAVKCDHARITYDDFLLLMKGQTRDEGDGSSMPSPSHKEPGKAKLHVVPEEGDGGAGAELKATSPRTPKTIELFSGDRVTMDGMIEPKCLLPASNQFSNGPYLPLTPIMSASDEGNDFDDAPLSMDDDNDIVASPGMSPPNLPLTPPITPKRGAADFVSPLRKNDYTFDPQLMMSSPDVALPLLEKPSRYERKRSRSMEETETKKALNCEASGPTFFTNARRAVLLPEYDATLGAFNGDSKTALQVNRQLYRAHRQMRISVLEASKRFEEEQARHAHDLLLAQQAEEVANRGLAGLVMRRVKNKTISSEAVKQLLEDNRKEQQSLMEVANRRGGRGRRTRKKTISDIGGMMGSLTQDELQKIASQAQEQSSSLLSSSSIKETLPPTVVEGTVPAVIDTSVPTPVGNDLRGATVPGEFRKVNDPFGSRGKYGRAS